MPACLGLVGVGLGGGRVGRGLVGVSSRTLGLVDRVFGGGDRLGRSLGLDGRLGSGLGLGGGCLSDGLGLGGGRLGLDDVVFDRCGDGLVSGGCLCSSLGL